MPDAEEKEGEEVAEREGEMATEQVKVTHHPRHIAQAQNLQTVYVYLCLGWYLGGYLGRGLSSFRFLTGNTSGGVHTVVQAANKSTSNGTTGDGCWLDKA